jgi:hypothetical protein
MDLFMGREQDGFTSAMCGTKIKEAEQKFRRCAMKHMTRILMMTMAATMTLTLLPTMAAAQMQPDSKLVAQVPFDFMIGGKIVPAGQFSVQRAAPGSIALVMRNRDAKVSVLCNAARDERKTPAATNTLVFNKYGHRYFLAQVKVEGSNVVYELPQGRAEAELKAQNPQAKEEILLALR